MKLKRTRADVLEDLLSDWSNVPSFITTPSNIPTSAGAVFRDSTIY